MKLSHKHRWLWLLAAMAVIAVVAFAACEEDKGGGKTPTPTAGERQDGGEMTVASFEFASLDPHFSSFAQDISLHRMIWRGLYSLDKDNKPQPAMAADMPVVTDDGKTYTMTLRDGLLWSDGEPLTAADFELGIKRTCNPAVAGEYEYVIDASIVGCGDHFNNEAGFDQALEDAIGVKALDDTTLEIKLNQAQPTWTIIMSLWMTFPAPKHLIQSSGAEWPTDPAKLAYNGPYILTAYSPQDSVTLVPNPNWAAPDGVKATLDKLTIKFIDDLAQADRAFGTGELDFANVDRTQLASIAAQYADEYLKVVIPSTRGVEMQMKNETLANLDVRLALSQAIDRVKLNEVVAGGGNEPSTTWLPPSTSGPAPDAFEAEIGFNVDSAKQHLSDAGYPGGAGFPTLTILTGDTPSAQKTGEFLVEQWNVNLGITVKQEVVDSKTRSQRFTDEQFELYPGGWIQDYPDAENWIVGLFNTGGTLNNYNCSDPEIDDLVEKAQFNTNDAERISQYQEANRLISTRACGIAPYWQENNHYLISSKVVGMKENATGQDGAMAGDWMAEAWGLAK
ncbi:MAG TPA: peptide ABC transporter substrate-binding protein [Dehalococcoidia bacterium]|nr:peptide ABC transporter substrate-binding protein [Dehalococcoidia bacterium]